MEMKKEINDAEQDLTAKMQKEQYTGVLVNVHWGTGENRNG